MGQDLDLDAFVETDTTTQRSLVGTTLDNRYKIESVLGEGGMSTVYKAQHQFLKKAVAVKVMQDSINSTSETFLRFQREAQAVAQLSHPNIISVMEFGIAESGEPYMVMDYLEGQSLSDRLKTKGRLQAEESLSIFRQVASALVHAHEKGILHRDLKPSNVMLYRFGTDKNLQVKVVDFGLARFLPQTGRGQTRLTAAGQLVGSPFYMSPEQIKDEELDARADVYAFGCMMFECLSGTRPFNDSNPISVLSMHLYDPAPQFSQVFRGHSIPKRMEDLVLKCLEKGKSKRFQTMAELNSELAKIEIWSETPVVSAPPPKISAPTDGEETQDSIPSGSISSRTGAFETSQYTLRLSQPSFARGGPKSWLRTIARPLVLLAKPVWKRVLQSFEGKGTDARKQRLSGTRVLIAALDKDPEHIKAADSDADKYKVYYKHVDVRKAISAQEFLVLLSTENYEIVHLHGTFDRNAIFKDASRFALRLSDIKRACDYAKVKLVWIASKNRVDWVRDNVALQNPTFHLVLTGDRGENFPKFLSGLLARLCRGESFSSSWSSYVPYVQYKGDRTDCKFYPGLADVCLLP